MFPDRQPFWRLDVMRSLLIPPTGAEIPLSAQRCIVLEMLMAEPGRIVPRSHILAALGHCDDEYGNHRLETLISRLRTDVRKSGPDAQLPIHARHNLGYAFHEEATIVSPEAKSRQAERPLAGTRTGQCFT
jgi:DNA-binding response OmpR family regulator